MIRTAYAFQDILTNPGIYVTSQILIKICCLNNCPPSYQTLMGTPTLIMNNVLYGTNPLSKGSRWCKRLNLFILFYQIKTIIVLCTQSWINWELLCIKRSSKRLNGKATLFWMIWPSCTDHEEVNFFPMDGQWGGGGKTNTSLLY